MSTHHPAGCVPVSGLRVGSINRFIQPMEARAVAAAYMT